MNRLRARIAAALARIAVRRARAKLAKDAEMYPEIFDQEKVKAYLST